MAEDADLLELTTLIVTNHVSNNSVHTADLAKLISSVHAALAGLDAPVQAPPEEPEHKAAVSVRKSLASDQHIVSMIDGKSYKTLRRHLSSHGLTDKDYRARYGLPADYPMVARAYSAARSAMAQAIGLGRKKATDVAAAVEQAAAPVAEKAKRGAKKAAATAETATKPAAKRARKTLSDAVASAKEHLG